MAESRTPSKLRIATGLIGARQIGQEKVPSVPGRRMETSKPRAARHTKSPVREGILSRAELERVQCTTSDNAHSVEYAGSWC